jgi:hypothetical protein
MELISDSIMRVKKVFKGEKGETRVNLNQMNLLSGDCFELAL